MNKHIFKILLIVSMLSWQSCERKEPFVYKYPTNPTYTWGYAEFWGSVYQHYDIEHHVLSLSLFTDSLFISDGNSLDGVGVYLNMDDVFIPTTDTIFPAGEYVVSQSIDSLNPVNGVKYGEVMTIARGEQYNKDGVKYDFGTYVYFIEELQSFTIRKFVVDGSMTVSYKGKSIYFDFDFVLDDKSILKGRYISLLSNFPIFDESVLPSTKESAMKINQRKPIIKTKQDV